MKLILSSPSPDDLVRLLRAWRFWLLGALIGALLGAAVYFIAPPPHRARAVVLVDFHLEEAWPQNTDREQFYYLERETRKLKEIAFSDEVLNNVASQVGEVTVQQLQSGKLQLSQPGNGGWHFYADDPDPAKAGALAGTWANAFAEKVKSEVVNPSGGLEQYITVDATQTMSAVAQEDGAAWGAYLLVGALVFLALAALSVLYFDLQQ
jgi:capsular polysaccharide biosynthesis protein